MSVTLYLAEPFGSLKIELFCEDAPKASRNFLALCAKNYYRGTIFHRNIKGFIVQGGDPTGTGKGGSSIYEGGHFDDEFSSSLKHEARGVVSMANSGPGTNGSQFFITYAGHPSLDGKYTVFGKVIAGWETLDKMEQQPVGKNNRPLNEIKIEEVKIHANPFAEKDFQEQAAE